MARSYVIALDVHCQTCEFAAVTPGGRIIDRRQVATAIPELTEAIRSVRRPRTVVLEEGPLADWLYRSLAPAADAIIVCDPRRNALIAKDGDKDDPIDAEKLAQLARGGYLRPVHHSASPARALFKQRVALYHQRVGHRVAQANRVIWYLRRFGIMIREPVLAEAEKRAALMDRLPKGESVREDLTVLLESYDLAAEHVGQLRQRLIKQARGIDQIRRFTLLPGVKWIRAATFYAYVDTPWRFKSKSALWKYLGIGLERRHSGSGYERLGVPRHCHRPLKSMILGAAKSAVASRSNPFADRYERDLHAGCSPRIARRNVARSMAAVMWGMWKTERDYQPQWVGVPADALMVGS
jgi:transposase